jgi:phage portal protein BeeE
MSVLGLFGLQQLSPNPADDWWYSTPGRQTAAGVPVDENIAMTYSACFAATMLLSSAGGMQSFNLLRKSDGGEREASDDSRYWMMRDTPNSDSTSMMYRASRIAQQVNRGNCYSEIERNRLGVPLRLWPIHASRIPPRTNIKRENGTLVYYVNNDDGSKTRIEAKDMLHVASPMSEDGVVGRGVVECARLSIGFGIATETQGAAYFGNSARPLVVIEGGKFKDKEDRAEYRRQWEEVHGGPANNARPAFLPPDAKLQTLSFSAEDSQFLECCVPETLVTLADGTQKLCDALTINDVVMGWDGTKLVPSQLEAIADNGVHPLIKVRTHRGRELVTTRNHPYLASKRQRCPKCSRRHGPAKHGLESNWIRADELSVGDYVRTGLRFGSSEPVAVQVEEAWYVGAMVGDGYCRGKKSIGFSNVDAGVIAKMRAFAESRGIEIKQKVAYPTDWYFVGRDWNDKYQESVARTILRPYDVLGRLAHDKVVPAKIAKAQPDAKAAFIAGLWDTDGTVSKATAKQPQLVLSSVSRHLLEDVQHLLASLGIQSSIVDHLPEGTRVIRGRECNVRRSYQLAVCGKSEARRFAELVAPHMGHEEKRARAEHFLTTDLGSSEHVDFFEYDRIIAIEELAPARTIAITVEGTHSHITNGLVTHNTRQHNVEEIARWYGVPPHLIGDLRRATFSNIEHQSLEFVKFSLMKWLVLWEQECNRKLLTPDERKTMYFRHNTDELERADLQTRTTAYQQQFFNGKLTLNEWRERDHENPIGPMGDLHFVQSAMVPLEIAAQGPQKPVAPPPKLEADPRMDTLATSAGELAMVRNTQKQLASAMLRDVWSRLLSVEINALKRVAEKPDKFGERLQEFYSKHRERMTRELSPPCDAYKAAGGAVPDDLVAAHITDSLERIESLKCADGAPTSVFDGCISLWHDERGLAL